MAEPGGGSPCPGNETGEDSELHAQGHLGPGAGNPTGENRKDHVGVPDIPGKIEKIIGEKLERPEEGEKQK